MSDVSPRLPQRPLLWSDAVLDLRDFLHDYHDPVYIVGGAVRDAYRHHPIKDLDLATEKDAVGLGRKIADLFAGDFYIMDAERGVTRVMIDTTDGKLVVDIARFREDTLLKDLSDRDFTLNAMAVDLSGDISLLIDPLNGENDLRDRILRRCSPHAISDDPVRGLRAVRQSVQLNARIEPETLKDVRANVDKLMDTSPERVRDEFFKILMSTEPAKALRIADSLGLLEQITPEVESLHGLPQPLPHVFDAWRHTLLVVEKLSGILRTISYQRTDETAANFELGMIVMTLDRFRQKLIEHIQQTGPNDRSYAGLMMFVAIMHDVGKIPNQDRLSAEIAEKRAIALRLSNDEKKRTVRIIENLDYPLKLIEPTKLELHRFWYPLREYGIDACLFALAHYLGTVGIELKQDEWLKQLQIVEQLLNAYFEEYEQIVDPQLVIDGIGLMEHLGIEQGKKIGQLLTVIREAQVSGEIESRADALQIAQRHLEND